VVKIYHVTDLLNENLIYLEGRHITVIILFLVVLGASQLLGVSLETPDFFFFAQTRQYCDPPILGFCLSQNDRYIL
jgi:hypothetical protein